MAYCDVVCDEIKLSKIRKRSVLLIIWGNRVAKGVPVDSQNDSGTPWIWAAGHDQNDAEPVLLEHNADLFDEAANAFYGVKQRDH
ncbi:hypothetical protein YC2023_080219 [Brassica napus]